MLKILNIVGARPNFMKIAPIYAEMKRRGSEFSPLIVHTGQHYDAKMSDAFFDDLGMPKPHIHLEIGSASHAVQTAKIMLEFEPVVLREKPDWVLVVGDVNSTIACALVSSKLGVKVAHVEAGLRSWDRTMPEEINRILTDSISDLLLTPSPDGNENLKKEGIPDKKVKLVGNVMIDSLFRNLEFAKASKILERYNLNEKDYAVLTLHRPSNVDDRETFKNLLNALSEISRKIPIIFPAHPRTASRIEEFGFSDKIKSSNIKIIEPLGYLDFLNLMSNSKLVLTDSGGLQEETTALKIPCLTLRENTERPITIEMGTNILVGTNPEKIKKEAFRILEKENYTKDAKIPPLWDGKTAVRICDELINYAETCTK
ncbi:MAG: UDP-N-acetylglucosamine 2-epimerase (non-hydrolyzing) [Acidobacteriota bacterium]|jgi:UDP-N-acetylglucosamine 2-epimerase (non-hydrolysing)|nr:UDP-N-acetylglucosamine 2-epimerase (non-hydrolyzing) [Acidobacteriota bacterium]